MVFDRVTILDEKIETIRRFLEKVTVLEADIRNSKIIEQKVIGNVIDTLDELCEDDTFSAVESSLLNETNSLQKKSILVSTVVVYAVEKLRYR